jgi:two-component system, NtrC family, response regulator GlrR
MPPRLPQGAASLAGQPKMKHSRILLLDGNRANDPNALNDLCDQLRQLLCETEGVEVRLLKESREPLADARKTAPALQSLADFRPDLVILALSAGELTRAALAHASIRGLAGGAPVLVIAGGGEPEEILSLLNSGVSDYVTPPLKPLDLLPRVWRLLGRAAEEADLIRALKEKMELKQLVGRSDAFLSMVEKIPAVARCDANVLIGGETGTGKELCARAVHYLSPRARQPFVPVNCGAIPVELVENELFGHERGAYTSAGSSRPGLINEADGGTIFFDEIDCLPLLAQVKLLRFLQEREYRPLGSARTRRANVRVIAAANTDLELAVREGRMRRDLYYRLNIISLTLPPLRERAEDIPLLARHFLEKYRAEFERDIDGFSDEAVQSLIFYRWPGNVRELEHTIERAVAMCERNLVRGRDLELPDWESSAKREPFQKLKNRVVAQFERNYIQELLLACQGNITRAAEIAQKNRRAFWQLIRKHKIDVLALKKATLKTS